MKYVLLIHMVEEAFQQLHGDERQAVVDHHRKLQRDMRRAGQFEAGIRLAPTNSSVLVTTRGDGQVITDGVYAETKEHLVGLYLLDCENLEQAIEYARRIPVVPAGTIEIRAVGWVDLKDAAVPEPDHICLPNGSPALA